MTLASRVDMEFRAMEQRAHKLQTENDALLAALRPFADAVYNDNGDMTVSYIAASEPYVKAYLVMRSCG